MLLLDRRKSHLVRLIVIPKSFTRKIQVVKHTMPFERDEPLSSQKLCRTYGGIHETNNDNLKKNL